MSTLNELMLGMLSKGAEQGSAAVREMQGKQMDLANLLAGQQQKHQLDEETSKRELKTAQDTADDYRKKGAKVNVKVGNASFGYAEPNSAALDRLNARQEAELSKRYEKLNGFNSTLNELEARTSTGGQGGVLTNPNAQFLSTGPVASKVPTSIMGLGEMFGAAPSGVSDERKLLERYQLEYQKAMTGQRTSSEMAQREKEAMGWIASGDPSLVAKGVRSMARNIRNQFNTIQGGYSPEVQAAVHSRMGNPMDLYKGVYEDAPIGSAPPPGAGTKTVVGQQRNKKTGEVRNVYSDGSTD